MEVLVESLAQAGLATDGTLEREFEQRLAECADLAFRVALGVLHNREDAEEAAQEAFVRAYRNFRELRDRERFRAWLVRIAWRVAIDRQRSRRRREQRELRALPDRRPASVEQLAAGRELRWHLERAIDELPEKLRVVVLLAAIQGHDSPEIARLLGVREGTVRTRLHAARRKLAKGLAWIVPAIRHG